MLTDNAKRLILVGSATLLLAGCGLNKAGVDTPGPNNKAASAPTAAPAATPEATSESQVQKDLQEKKLWETYTRQGDEAYKKGDKNEAEKNYQLAIQEAEKLGSDSLELSNCVSTMANFYYAQGNGSAADQMYRRSMYIKERVLGDTSAELVQDLVGLARVCISINNNPEAVMHLDRAADILKKANKPIPPVIEELKNSANAKIKNPKA